MQKANRKLLAFGAVASLFLLPIASAADQAPPRVLDMKSFRTADRIVIQSVAQMMDSQHLSKHNLDDEISKRAFEQFFKALDPFKLYFYQSDIDTFLAEFQTKIDDEARKGNKGEKGDFPVRVFKTFLTRVEERVKMAHEEIDRDHDFTVEEKMIADRDAMEYPKTPKKLAIAFASRSSTACCC